VYDPDATPTRSTFVVVAIPGGTYTRKYWDLEPLRREGYSQAAWHAARGEVFIACDYLGGGDSTRPPDGDFMTLEACADAAHVITAEIRDQLAAGTLAPDLPSIESAIMVGIGQSLGGFITMIQQGKYADYPGIGIFGASPLLIANIPAHERTGEDMSPQEMRAWLLEANAKSAGIPELTPYHSAPRELYAGVFHVQDVPSDLLRYDIEHTQGLISRVTGVDGMTPGLAQPFADKIDTPVFLAFGAADVSADPRREPTGYPASPHITLTVVPSMAHMHNFAETRQDLWRAFAQWLFVAAPSS
jgi:alpha-beta hydrolase superfamily lysophospholipase